jgi:hypothetical protein
MRMMMTVISPNEKFNAAVRDGTAGQKIQAILEDAQPESVYFTEKDGKRCTILIVDIEDSSAVPSLAEPWFMTFDSEVHFSVIMSPEDLARGGLEELGKKWG